jgi:hypothetical protein
VLIPGLEARTSYIATDIARLSLLNLLWARTSFPIVRVIVFVLVISPGFYQKNQRPLSFTSFLPPRPALDQERPKLENEHDDENEHD